jgi:O-antigen/teichoic acid export membrane protein
MNFRSLELRYTVGTVAGGIGAVVVAAMGYGAWAFVTSEIVLAAVSTVLLWSLVAWRPHLRFGRRNFRDLSGYGLRALGGATFTNLSRNADNILIGRYLGAYSLGLYAFAYNVMLASVTKIVVPVQQVVFPALSRLQDDQKRLATSWLRASRILVAISVPLLLVIMVTAGDLVPLVFGSKWDSAVPLVQILCWAGTVECLVALNEVVLKAQNAVKTYLNFNAVAFGINLSSFVVGLHWGVNGVATAFAVSSTGLGVVYTWLVARRTKLSLRRITTELRGVALAIVGMAGCCLVARWLLVTENVPTGVRLVVAIELAVSSYVWFLRWFARDVLSEMRLLLFPSKTDRARGPLTTDARPAAAARA